MQCIFSLAAVIAAAAPLHADPLEVSRGARIVVAAGATPRNHEPAAIV